MIFGDLTRVLSSLQQFDAAAEHVKNLKVAPSIEDFLALYSLYKQATVGDVNIGKFSDDRLVMWQIHSVCLSGY